MRSKVNWTAKIKPLFHGGKDNERVLFCRPALSWKETIAFLHVFFDQPRNLAPSVFEVLNVDRNALLERAAFALSPFSGVQLSAAPACWDFPREGLRRMLCWRGADREADFGGKSQQAGTADSGTPEKGKRTKAARSKSASRSTLRTSKTNGAKSRGRSKKR